MNGMNGPTFNVPTAFAMVFHCKHPEQLQSSLSYILQDSTGGIYGILPEDIPSFCVVMMVCHVASESHCCIICGVLILVVFIPCLFLHDPDEFMTERLLRTLLYFFSIELDNLFIC